NATTRAPLYDVESLRLGITLWPRFAAADLGGEAENPRYRPVAPLSWASTRGAAVPVGRWRALRSVSVGAGQDIYTLTLSASDVGMLRPDAGDLRIVDEGGRQVPYVIDPAAAEDSVALALQHEDGAPETHSRYRLQ